MAMYSYETLIHFFMNDIKHICVNSVDMSPVNFKHIQQQNDDFGDVYVCLMPLVSPLFGNKQKCITYNFKLHSKANLQRRSINRMVNT
jgi:hypothetical protein